MALEDRELAAKLEERGIHDARVLQAIAGLDRVRFVPEEVRAEAAHDAALPIGFGQTISQPYVVAFMTEVLAPRPGARVLEVGTGSGYQAAVLLALGCDVYSIERVPELAAEARERLASLGHDASRLHLRVGDGGDGWPEAAPFEGILVTAGTDAVPPALVDQLALGGRLVAPVGSSDTQQLLLLVRTERGIVERWMLPVRFVPLIRSGP